MGMSRPEPLGDQILLGEICSEFCRQHPPFKTIKRQLASALHYRHISLLL